MALMINRLLRRFSTIYPKRNGARRALSRNLAEQTKKTVPYDTRRQPRLVRPIGGRLADPTGLVR